MRAFLFTSILVIWDYLWYCVKCILHTPCLTRWTLNLSQSSRLIFSKRVYWCVYIGNFSFIAFVILGARSLEKILWSGQTRRFFEEIFPRWTHLSFSDSVRQFSTHWNIRGHLTHRRKYRCCIFKRFCAFLVNKKTTIFLWKCTIELSLSVKINTL